MINEEKNEEYVNLEDMPQNSLDDIVLDNYDKKEKIKKYALIGGSILILFLIVIYAVKFFLSSSEVTQESFTEDVKIEEQSDDYEAIPIISEDSITEEETAPKEENKEVANEENLQSNMVNEDEEEVKKVVNSVLEQKNKAEEKTTNISNVDKTKMTEQKTVDKTSKATQKANNQPAQKETKQKKEVAKTKTEKIAKKSETKKKTAVKGRYYIQVGAFSKYPDKRFLQKIKNSGFDYKIKEITVNGKNIKRVYIGPFASKKEAQKFLQEVKSKINKDAFIKRL
jgi:DedD protein